MEVYQVSYYGEFQCLAQDCPDCCCRGWRIPLTDADVARYRAAGGLAGFALHCAMQGDETLRVFSKQGLRCPFLKRSGLCGLQRRHGEAFIPEVCRSYPRVVTRHMERAELQLDLSCVHAAALFLRHRKTQRLCAAGEEATRGAWIEPYGNNDDAAYLEALLGVREEVIAALRGCADAAALDRCLRRIAGWARRIQEETLSGEAEGAEVLRRHPYAASRESEAVEKSLFPLPIAVLNDLLSTDFFEEGLRTRAPQLYRLCRVYYRQFDRLSYAEGEERLRRMFREQVIECPEEAGFYADHIGSMLLRHLAEAFEDYSLYRHILDAVLVSALVLLFRLLQAEYLGGGSEASDAQILSVVEKRYFHNERIQKQFHRVLAAYLSEGARPDAGLDRKKDRKKA